MMLRDNSLLAQKHRLGYEMTAKPAAFVDGMNTGKEA